MHWKQVVLTVTATLLAQSTQAQALKRDLFCIDGQVEAVDETLVAIQQMRSTLDDCLSEVSATSATCQAAFVDTKFFIGKRANAGGSQFSCLNEYMTSMKPYDIASSQVHMRLLNETGIYVQGIKSFIDTKVYRQFDRVYRSSQSLPRPPGATRED
jgi:hypothetical protein